MSERISVEVSFIEVGFGTCCISIGGVYIVDRHCYSIELGR